MDDLKIGTGLALPRDVVTQRLGIVGKTGSGKTHTAVVLAEEMIGHDIPVAIVDPQGAWWGLRSSKCGKRTGLPVIVLGGDDEHRDVPLEDTGGAVIADWLVDTRAPCVLDLSHLSGAGCRRFVTDFAERLFHRNRTPLHLILDEADMFAPQRPMQGDQRMLGAVNKLSRRGRQRGLGLTLVTQRPAVIHKDVLTQIEVLIAHRLTGPQDRDAIKHWIEYHGTSEERRKVLGSLAKLERGTAWFWSPGWLELMKRVKVRQRRTFDSSKTPELGAHTIAPKRAAVDLEALAATLATTIERAKENDPRELKRRIAKLERDLAAASAATPEPVEVSVLTDDDRAMLDGHVVTLVDASEQLRATLTQFADLIRATGLATPPPAPGPRRAPEPTAPATDSTPRRDAYPVPKLGKASRLVLVALLQQFPRAKQVEIRRLAILTGYKAGGSSMRGACAELRRHDLIGSGSPVELTTDGHRIAEALGGEPLPTGAKLADYWLGELGKAPAACLREIIANPRGIDPIALAERVAYEPGGSSMRGALAKLRGLGLINGKAWLEVSEDLVG